MVCFFEKIRIILKVNLLKGRVAKSEGTLADFGKCPFCMQKWVTKLAGTGSLYTDKSRMKKA